jgi:tmRNA-binding protein
MTLIEYKKALLRFAPQETFAAGLELLGTEVKALRARLGSLDGARVVVRGGEAPPFLLTKRKTHRRTTTRNVRADSCLRSKKSLK